MESVTLKVYKWDSNKESPPLQDICTSIKMNSSFKNICTELQFTIAYDYNDYDWFNFELGDEVVLWYKSLKVFYGKITDSNFNIKNNTYTFTCYDFSWWLSKNNISHNFDNVSVYTAINSVLQEVLLSCQYEQTDESFKDIMVGSHLIKNKSTKDVLQAILSSATKITGKYYYIHMSYYSGLLQITEADKYYSGLTIQQSTGTDIADGNLIDYTIERSMQNMINTVKIYDNNFNEVDTKTANNTDRFGTIEDTIILDAITDNEDDNSDNENTFNQNDLVKAQDQATKKIENYGQPEEVVTVKCLGDINYRVGFGVMVKLPDSYFYDKFMYIIASEWEWTKSGDFISTLSLANSKKHELVEWEDIETIRDANENGVTGVTDGNVISAVNWMIDIANNDIHGYDQNDRWGPDYDCSSLVIAGFEQAGIPLKSKGATYTGNMKEVALSIGFEDINWGGELNELSEGDILLNEVHHVAVYIGHGQIVSARCNENGGAVGGLTGDQTGKEICISDFYNYPWDCVLRYNLSNSNSSNSEVSSGGVSAKYIEVLKLEEGFVSHWDNSSSYGAIGYGTDASSTVGQRLKAQGVTSCTKEQATVWLKEEVEEWANAVNTYLKKNNITLYQNYFDAVVDIAYQWGNRRWKIVVDKLASGDVIGAKAFIMDLGYPTRDKTRCNIIDGNYEYAG